jgi:hypothetical protein
VTGGEYARLEQQPLRMSRLTIEPGRLVRVAAHVRELRTLVAEETRIGIMTAARKDCSRWPPANNPASPTARKFALAPRVLSVESTDKRMGHALSGPST